MSRIAFDIDGTLLRIVEDSNPSLMGIGAVCACGKHMKQEVNDDLVKVLMWCLDNDHDVFVWSAGGPRYAQAQLDRWLPELKDRVTVIEKLRDQDIDLCYDDQEVKLATVNLKLKSLHADHWQ